MSKTEKTLATLLPKESGTVRAVRAEDAMAERFRDLGLIRGTKLLCTARSFHGDISVYRIRGASIAIRDCDAASVILE